MKSGLLTVCAIGCAVWLALSATPAHVVRAELQPITAKSEHAKAVKYDQTHREASNFDLTDVIEYLTADFYEAAERAIDGRRSDGDTGSETSDTNGAVITGEPLPEPDIEGAYEPEPEPVEDSRAAQADSWEDSLTYAGEWTITFYCQCEQCCGRWAWSNSTASGNTPIPWYTVAAGESFPFGTVLYIEGFGTFEVMDRGVPDGWADIYVSSHGEIPSYGMTTASVYLIN